MTEAKIETPNIKFNGVKLQIFDKIGFNSGNHWVINAFSGCFVEVDPSPIGSTITGVINSDISAGNVDKIDHVTMNPSNLLCLFLEGALPISSIINAEDRGLVAVFKDVPFKTSNGVINFNLFVSDSYKIATIDENGDIV